MTINKFVSLPDYKKEYVFIILLFIREFVIIIYEYEKSTKEK